MPSKKTYIILITIMVLFGIIMFLIFGIPNIRQENLESVLIVGDNTTWIYKDKKWFNQRYKTSKDRYSWQEFKVFEDNKELGTFYLWHDDKWYLFDKDKNAVLTSGKIIAYQSNYSMKLLEYTEDNVDDFTYVNEVLMNNNLSTSSKFSSIYKVSIDFDSDSNLEDFYIITNVFPLDFEPETSFAIAFMVKNDTIYTLYEDVSTSNGLNGCKPFYNTFIDTNIDGVYEVILSCGQYSAEEQIDMLYQFSEGEFKLLVSNQ